MSGTSWTDDALPTATQRRSAGEVVPSGSRRHPAAHGDLARVPLEARLAYGTDPPEASREDSIGIEAGQEPVVFSPGQDPVHGAAADLPCGLRQLGRILQ